MLGTNISPSQKKSLFVVDGSFFPIWDVLVLCEVNNCNDSLVKTLQWNNMDQYGTIIVGGTSDFITTKTQDGGFQ